MVSYQLETWEQYYPDCLPLWQMHHDEIESQVSDLPFDPDLEQSKALCKAGIAQITTARDLGRMIGYMIWFVTNCLTSKGVKTAAMGPWFVEPDYRGGTVSPRLFAQSLNHMNSLGVRWVFPHHWLVGDSAKAGRIFRHHGAVPAELTYSLRLGA